QRSYSTNNITEATSMTTSTTSTEATNYSETTTINTDQFSYLNTSFSLVPFENNTKWRQNGITIVDRNIENDSYNGLSDPYSIYINNDTQTFYITDYHNHRIVEWKSNTTRSQVVAGGNSKGNHSNQLNNPTDVIVDKKNDSLIICDSGNRRIVRWRLGNTASGETIISDISCYDLAIDNDGDLYVLNYEENEVRRWRVGEKTGTIIAGGNGYGDDLNQLNFPNSMFIKDHSLYVSDSFNHRVMKWIIGEKEGIIVAGGHGVGRNLTQLSYPLGVIVDHLDDVYVVDSANNRIMRYPKGSQLGIIIAGGNGIGQQPNQFKNPSDLALDGYSNLYVVDNQNKRIQKFEADLN
ncbi:unnamed protein product, partial [Adineta steineri]